MIDAVRRQEIRSRVAAKRDAAVQLQSQLTVAYLKAQITLWCNWLTDVEQLFLNNIDEARTADAEASLNASEPESRNLGSANAIRRCSPPPPLRHPPPLVSQEHGGGSSAVALELVLQFVPLSRGLTH